MEFRSIKNLIGFLRLKITIFGPIMAATGYLLFNKLSFTLIPIILASFFILAAGYAYNSITDVKEDLINKKKINPLALSDKGPFIVVGCFVIGFIFSLFLSIHSILIYGCFTVIAIIYSLFRVKQYFLIKNIYTGLTLPLIFLLGAFATQFTPEIIITYYPLIAIYILAGSLVSDLRDYSGDKNADIITMPVALGFAETKILIYSLYVVFIMLILLSRVYNLFIFIPFIILVIFFLVWDRPHIAHACGGLSFFFWLISLTVDDFI